jgi:outer membrane receptor protein involved in Fe transport
LISTSQTYKGEPANGGLSCVGSSNYNRWISIDNSYAGLPYDLFQTGNGQPGSGMFVPHVGGSAQSFNFGPLQYLQRPDTRYQGGFFAHYQENKELDVYSSFMFTDDHTVEELAPSGLFLGSGVISGALDEVNCSNPLMTAQEKASLCSGNAQAAIGNPCTPKGDTGNCNLTPGQSLLEIGRRDLEGGNRITDLHHASYRMQIGAKGDLGDGWAYDVYGQYGTTLFSQSFSGNFSKSRVQSALEVDPATGKCFAAEPNAQGITTDANCVPLDIFNGIGSISPQALNYVSDTGFQTGYTTEQIVSGNLTGDLGAWGIQSPWAKNPVAVSIGTEWRNEELELNVSRDFYSNDIDGSGGATLPVPESGFNVSEGFTEVKIPLVQGIPFVEDLSATGGYRYSSYSIAGGVSAYKDGIEWQPIDDIRFRGSFERAVRAPNVLELFAPLNVVLFSGQDPCATQTTGQCANVKNAGSGILACPAAQCNNQTGGSTALKPETAATRTVGFVFTPTFLDGFTATIDYFDIKVSKFIGVVGADTILSECYGPAATSGTEATFCPLVHRNAIGQIYGGGYVQNTTQNTGYLQTDGVDIELNYAADMADWGMGQVGSLNFNMVGTYLDSLKTEPLADPGSIGTYQCAGLYGTVCLAPNPKWRHKFRVTWTSPWDVDVSLDWRHMSGVSFDSNTTNPLLNGVCGGPCGDVADDHLSSFDWFDLALDWQVREGIDLRAGVNNLFAKEPPIMDTNSIGASSLGGFGNGNTYPGVYDSMGRTVFVGATIKY